MIVFKVMDGGHRRIFKFYKYSGTLPEVTVVHIMSEFAENESVIIQKPV